jgi:hypothetical protein
MPVCFASGCKEPGEFEFGLKVCGQWHYYCMRHFYQVKGSGKV